MSETADPVLNTENKLTFNTKENTNTRFNEIMNWYQNMDSSEMKRIMLTKGREYSPYIGVIFALLIVHLVSTYMYTDYCVVTYYRLYNIVFSVSPLCSYLLDIITICQGSLNKMWYIFGGFVIMKITSTFSKMNVFSNYSKKPEITT